ncbi:MAG: T9SS type A sorting domain-containing protein [Bacteroidota bacterium]
MKLKPLLFIVTMVTATGLFAQDLSSATGIFKFDDETSLETLFANELDDASAAGEYAAFCDGVMKRPAGADGSDYNPEASVLDTDFSVVEGVDGSKAIRVETGSFLYFWHGLSADSSEQYFSTSTGDPFDEVYVGEGVNSYTVMMDVKMPDITKVYTLLEINPHTTSGGKSGEVVITDTKLGADYSPFSGQYSSATVEADKWHRIAYVANVYFDADSTDGNVRMYLDGVLVNEVAYGSVDGSSSPYAAVADGSGDDNIAAFKVSGNNEGPDFDNQHDIDNLIIFDKALSSAEIAAFGGTEPAEASATGIFRFDDETSLETLFANELDDATAAGEYAAFCDGVMKRPAGADGSDYNPEASVLDTDYSVVDGVDGKAIRIETGSFLYLWHGLSADSSKQYFSTSSGDPFDEVYVGEGVNNYTVMMDVKIPDLAKVYTLLEINPHTTSGGKSGEIVITDALLGADYSPFRGQYSTTTVEADKWHRIAYVANVYFDSDSVDGSVKIYLDGVNVNEIAYGSVDGSSSPYAAVTDGSGDDDIAAFKVCGNNEGPDFDNQLDIDNLIIFDRALTDAEMTAYGAPVTDNTKVKMYDESETLHVYPNPTTDFLTVDVAGKAEFKLYNSLGQIVLTKTIDGRSNIDVRSMDKGLYIVQLQDEGGKVSSAKVILK